MVDDPMEETKTNKHKKKTLFSLKMKMETGMVESVQRERGRLSRAGFPQTVTGTAQSQDLKSRVTDILRADGEQVSLSAEAAQVWSVVSGPSRCVDLGGGEVKDWPAERLSLTDFIFVVFVFFMYF